MAEDAGQAGESSNELVFVDDDHVLDIDEEDEVVPFSSLTSYGADFDVAGLVRRLEADDILIPTFDPDWSSPTSNIEGFQRGFVWKVPQVHRFVESLLLGLPVPGIFLVREPDDTLLVLDGQQRLRSLHAFYTGVLRGREFRLRNVQSQFEGMRYQDLDDEYRRRLDNQIIHATVVRQDVPSSDQSSIYMIFERLNTGGTALAAHEIRVALYRGNLLALLRELNENTDWRAMYGRKSPQLKDQELILRFFALFDRAASYSQPMKGFLNEYMADNHDLTEERRGSLASLFGATVELLNTAIGPGAFRLETAVNAAVLDSVMVGVARRLAAGPVPDPEGVSDANARLRERPEYVEIVQRTTANEERVRARLMMATEAFADVK